MANNNNTKYLLILTLKITAMLQFQYTEVTKYINTTESLEILSMDYNIETHVMLKKLQIQKHEEKINCEIMPNDKEYG